MKASEYIIQVKIEAVVEIEVTSKSIADAVKLPVEWETLLADGITVMDGAYATIGVFAKDWESVELA